MDIAIFFSSYARWHYTQALADFLFIWRTFLWFVVHLFSIGELLRTLFSPLKRLHERYPRTLSLEGLFGTLVVNVLMRLVGAVARLIVILMGSVALVLLAVFGAVSLLLWIFMPLLLLFLFVWGIVISL